jgi:ATPase family associated with various cellular activities (AAA)
MGDLVLSPAVEQDLRNLIRLMDAREAERLKVPVPAGLLLVGPSGSGKTSIAQLIATQTRRSFYAITPADVPTPEKLAQVFARAREHSPSIILIDEIDGLLPRGDNGYYMGQHQVQFVDQALTLMSQLEPAHQVFLIGTTNRPDGVDPRGACRRAALPRRSIDRSHTSTPRLPRAAWLCWPGCSGTARLVPRRLRESRNRKHDVVAVDPNAWARLRRQAEKERERLGARQNRPADR